MKTIEELIEDLVIVCRKNVSSRDLSQERWRQSVRMEVEAEDELKRRVRDQELMLWALCNGCDFQAVLRAGCEWWLWTIWGDSMTVKRTGPLPELNDELRERLEKEFDNAKANEG